MVEDSEDDTLLVLRELRTGGFKVDYARVETAEQLIRVIKQKDWDIIISDYVLPRFSGLVALKTVQNMGIDLPFLIVSGIIGEEVAVEAMLAGAHDYILKGNLKRLVPAVKRALREARERRARRQAEAALRESQGILSTLMSNLPGMAYRCRNDRDRTMEYVSAGCFSLTGHEAKYLKKKGTIAYSQLIHPEDRAQVWAKIQAAVSQSVSFELEYRIFTADGEEKWVWEQGRGAWDKQGESYIEGFITDISKRKEIERALKYSEEKYRTIFENNATATVIIDEDANILLANPEFEKLTGFSGEEAESGKSWADFLDGSELMKMPAYQKLSKKTNPGAPHSHLEFRFTDKDQNIREALMNVTEIPGAGKAIVSILDITERKKAERSLTRSRYFYLTLLDEFPALIWRSGLDAKCDYFNKTWLAFTGRTLEQEIGDGWAEGVHPDDFERCLRTYLEAFRQREPFTMEYRLRRYDGKYCWIIDMGRPFNDLEGNFSGYIGACYDITERREAEEALRRYELISGHARDIILFMRRDGLLLEANQAAVKAYGYPREELLSLCITDIRGEDTVPLVARQMEQAEHKGILFETVHRRKDGSTFPVEVSSQGALIGGERVLISVIRDITKRKLTEDNLRSAHQQLLDIIEFLPDPTFVIDRAGTVIAWNRAIEEMTGVNKLDIVGKGNHAYAVPFYGENISLLIDCIIDGTCSLKYGSRIKSIKGTTFFENFVPEANGGKGAYLWSAASPLFDPEGNLVGAIETIRDITEQKSAEQEIRHRLAVGEAIASTSSMLMSPQGVDLTGLLKILGETVAVSRAYIFEFRENFQKMDNTYEWCAKGVIPFINYLQNLPTEMFPWWMKKLYRGENIVISDVDKLPPAAQAEKEILREQEIRSLLVVPIYSTNGSLTGYMGFDDTKKCREWSSQDIQALRVAAEMVGMYWEQKQAKEALQMNEQRLRDIVEHSTNLFYSHTPEHILTYVSPQVKDFLDCEPEEALVSWSTFLSDHPVNARGLTHTQRAIDTGERQPVYELELVGKSGRRVWVEASETPVVREGKTVAVVGALTNITERKHSEARLQQSFEKLKQTLEQTVNTLSLTLEIRDTYTAGHQQRVARLSCAIARAMGLSTVQIEGIRIAAALHDIGKISIPSEILSKPGKISGIEFSLIKTHPQVGYDILKNINFTWPIAEIVWQHHERWDGSGYPSGLAGDDILLEARIIAVADVIEAMSSHRPYRPSLGLEKALEEIQLNKGKFYDFEVAEACLSLFQQKAFNFD